MMSRSALIRAQSQRSRLISCCFGLRLPWPERQIPDHPRLRGATCAARAMHVEIAGRLRRANARRQYQVHRIELEFSAELPSLPPDLRVPKNLVFGVPETGAVGLPYRRQRLYQPSVITRPTYLSS
jgi:hypothetical protein